MINRRNKLSMKFFYILKCFFNSLDNTDSTNNSASEGITKTSATTENDQSETRPPSNSSSETDSTASSKVTRYLIFIMYIGSSFFYNFTVIFTFR